ncbi:hypothetical protein [Escherichia coli]|uniref:hypothetical protein n=1 Tax=Escherichia coli TaxID=562 RepID=UPI0035252766
MLLAVCQGTGRDVAVPLSAAPILTAAVSFCLPRAPSAPGCLAASGRQARLRQAAAGAPASLRRTRWRGFGLSLRSDA